jgi:hypothetical protein
VIEMSPRAHTLTVETLRLGAVLVIAALSSACGAGGEPMPLLPDTVSVQTNGATTCGVARDGRIRCWGRNTEGQLGRGTLTSSISAPVSVPTLAEDVLLGGPAVQLALGGEHLCALTAARGVRCWGSNRIGQLGYPTAPQGLDLPAVVPAQLGDVPMQSPVAELASGFDHNCARTSDQRVYCWGNRRGFSAGVGVETTASELAIGTADSPIRQLAAGLYLVCALFDSGLVRCWGNSPEPSLRASVPATVETPPLSFRDTALKGPATRLAIGNRHICALMTSGAVRCWGNGEHGVLGYGHARVVTDPAAAGDAGDLSLGGKAIDLVAGTQHTCALLEGGAVRCWGLGDNGRLGHAHTRDIGDDELPVEAGDVPVGGRVSRLSVGGAATCALLEDGSARCWGHNTGALGTGDFQDRGDDERPDSTPSFTVFEMNAR